MNDLGWMYFNGAGVKQDKHEGFYWYLQAAMKDDSASMYSVGIIYEYGQGATKDMDKALAWLRKSAALGYKKAQDELAALEEKGATN